MLQCRPPAVGSAGGAGAEPKAQGQLYCCLQRRVPQAVMGAAASCQIATISTRQHHDGLGLQMGRGGMLLTGPREWLSGVERLGARQRHVGPVLACFVTAGAC